MTNIQELVNWLLPTSKEVLVLACEGVCMDEVEARKVKAGGPARARPTAEHMCTNINR